MLTYHLLLLFSTLCTLSFALDDRLAFVYELVRHGARAPVTEKPIAGFGVPDGMLTRSGMRQRYLLGRYNRRRYIERGQLLD